MASDLHRFTARLSTFLIDSRYRTEVTEEILDHLESAAADLEASRVDSAEARRLAMAAFGDPDQIGHLLQQTPRGGTPMRLARFGGACGNLSGILFLLLFAAEYLISHARSPFPQPLGDLLPYIIIPWVSLMLVTLAGVYLRHPGHRTEKLALLGLQWLGGLNVLVTYIWLEFFVAGLLLLSSATALSGLLLLFRGNRSNRTLAVATAVAGAGMTLVTPPVWHLLGGNLGVLLVVAAAGAWIMLGTALLSRTPSCPAPVIRVE